MTDEVTSDAFEKELAALPEIMQQPDVAEASGLMLLVWRMFYCVRLALEKSLKDKLSNESFSYMLSALQVKASEQFSIKDVKEDVKKRFVPFLTGLIRELDAEKENAKRAETRNRAGDAASLQADVEQHGEPDKQS